jgi:sporulation protein YlmC with PRC-barrel domain|tara:strand:- start:14534 stop:14734 length:201 start_codon:yes stop_codon:yes gene_type:complete
MKNRNSDLGKGKKVFISYLNDDNQTISGFVILLEISNGLVVFQTQGNIIRIPSSRVLKIKEKTNGN